MTGISLTEAYPKRSHSIEEQSDGGDRRIRKVEVPRDYTQTTRIPMQLSSGVRQSGNDKM